MNTCISSGASVRSVQACRARASWRTLLHRGPGCGGSGYGWDQSSRCSGLRFYGRLGASMRESLRGMPGRAGAEQEPQRPQIEAPPHHRPQTQAVVTWALACVRGRCPRLKSGRLRRSWIPSRYSGRPHCRRAGTRQCPEGRTGVCEMERKGVRGRLEQGTGLGEMKHRGKQ